MLTRMTTAELSELVDVLHLDRVAERSFLGRHLTAAGGGRVVFGGQLLAQTVMAASAAVPDKAVKSLHAVFLKGADLQEPVEISVDVLRAGSAFASTSVSVRQGGTRCVEALVLLDVAGEELARHASPMPPVVGPELATPLHGPGGVEEVRVVGGVDLGDRAATGPAELRLWTRFAGAPDEEPIGRALLAYASEPFFFGTALRPHDGFSQAMAYRELFPAVVTHTVTYHDSWPPSSWLLHDLAVPHLGRGRIFGSSSVFASDGRLVASVTQENQLRPIRP